MKVRKKSQKHFLKVTVTVLLIFLETITVLSAVDHNENSPFIEVTSATSESGMLFSAIDKGSFSPFPSLITVGDPFNAPDDQGLGTVNTIYQIGEYEVTARQYATFLNAVAWKEDSHGLYHPEMGTDQKIAYIQRVAKEDGTYRYDLIDDQRASLPITYVSLNDAKRYCNWLENGAPGPDQEYQLLEKSTESGAYAFLQNGNQTIVEINPQSHYHIPSDDEWIKAAYYKGKGRNAGYWLYPTQHNAAPSNGIGDVTNFANYQTYRGNLRNNFLDDALMITTVDCFNETATFYQTHDMGGNVAEWTISPDSSECALTRGGSWQSIYSWYGNNDLMRTASPKSYDPSTATNFIGFRIAAAAPQASIGTENSGIRNCFETATSNHDSTSAHDSKSIFQNKQLWTTLFITAATLSGTACLFIIGELVLDYWITEMTLQEIAATFPKGRIIMIISHLGANTCAIAKTENVMKSKN